MSVSLYFDHNVRFAIVLGLRQREVDVLTTRDDGFDTADDPDVLARATELRRVTFTNDDDFLAVAREWLQSGRSFAGVVYAHPRLSNDLNSKMALSDRSGWTSQSRRRIAGRASERERFSEPESLAVC
jgi:hypothetical protein